jgi:Domain of unknown function (DUF6378)
MNEVDRAAAAAFATLEPPEQERRSLVDRLRAAREPEKLHPVRDGFYSVLLREAQALSERRSVDYDVGSDPMSNYERAAKIASLKLGYEITPYAVLIVMESVKDARRCVNPTHRDSHVDGINYRAFAAQAAMEKGR